MTDERWDRLKQSFADMLARPPAERAAFLDELAATDPSLRTELESLLAHHESDTFLDKPAATFMPSSSPPVAALRDGATVGSYRILRPIGRGGMATVYMAQDLRHRRSVALKVLHAELAHALGADRFLKEIEVAARLSHPHILPLFDSGQVEGLLYYVMPYVVGESLRDRLRREGQLPLADALQIARETADALMYAHGQGIIHRDVKPENILLSGGHALVADFGIARALEASEQARLTDTGMAVGTVAYMSPEQASGVATINGRTDIYSLGCVLFEMLAGEAPHTGPTPQAVLLRRMMDPAPSVRQFRSAIPAAVEYAVTRALAPVPADRFQTMADLRQALESTAASGPASTQSAERVLWLTRRRVLRIVRRPAAIIVVALLPTAIVALLWLSKDRSATPLGKSAVTRSTLADSALRRETTPKNAEGPSAGPPSPSPAPVPTVAQRDTTTKSGPSARRTVSPATTPTFGLLTIDSDPFGTVFVDGVEVGDVPVVNQQLTPGRHVVEVRREGFQTTADTVEAVAGNPIRLRKRLLPK